MLTELEQGHADNIQSRQTVFLNGAVLVLFCSHSSMSTPVIFFALLIYNQLCTNFRVCISMQRHRHIKASQENSFMYDCYDWS